jgi:hypothetical protein
MRNKLIGVMCLAYMAAAAAGQVPSKPRLAIVPQVDHIIIIADTVEDAKALCPGRRVPWLSGAGRGGDLGRSARGGPRAAGRYLDSEGTRTAWQSSARKDIQCDDGYSE